MDRIYKRTLVYSLSVFSLAFCLQGSRVSYAAQDPASTGQPGPQGQAPQGQQPQGQPPQGQQPQGQQPQGSGGAQGESQMSHQKKVKKAFKLGVCVGEFLSKQGTAIPFDQPGSQTIDEATKKSIKEAVKECRTQIQKQEASGAGASGSAADPSAEPTEEDTQM